ncbi:MAG: Na/Pi cotransporter family protein [Acutalibacteraceae bacterium]
MDLFSILSFIGGLALFLYGMNVMGDGLEKTSDGRLEKTLEKMSNTTVKGLLLGAGVTAVIQSSSATTVMVVGFVNSGIMKLYQAIGIIMGANIGTTITGWILSLTGIEGDSLVMQLIQPKNFSPVVAIIGIFLIMFCKDGKKKNIGSIMVGFAVLMFGMTTMSGAMTPLADNPDFANFLIIFQNPIFGILAGALLTAVIQSSSASVGILQALASTGIISVSTAIPIVMGQNIGTCVTALLSCIGAKKNAKRAAFVHLYFNVIGSLVVSVIFYAVNAFVNFSFVNEVATPASIAIIHTCFNVLVTVLLFPFSKLLEKLACLTIKDKVEDEDAPFLDQRFLNTPGLATEQCHKMAVKMAVLSKKTILDALTLIENGYDEKLAQTIIDREDAIDNYEDVLGSYLVKLSSKTLSVSDSKEVSKLLHCIGDFERIGDHALNIHDVSKEMEQKKISFSPQAMAEIKVMTNALREILDIAITAFTNNDYSLADKVEPLEQVIDNLRDKLKKRHIARLREGGCTIELGFIFSDLLTNYERVSDHCSNIAVCMIQVNKESFETHEYLHEIRGYEFGQYRTEYEGFKKKYTLPENTSVQAPEAVQTH